jgi:hypothetical protein
VPRSSKGYSHTYNTWMQLSRLQRIYRHRYLTLGVVGSSHLSNGNQLMKSDRVYFFSRNSEDGIQHCLVSMDSDLEAFSRNPTRGSFAALAFQPAAFTNYANLVFLSY